MNKLIPSLLQAMDGYEHLIEPDGLRYGPVVVPSPEQPMKFGLDGLRALCSTEVPGPCILNEVPIQCSPHRKADVCPPTPVSGESKPTLWGWSRT